MFLRVHSKPKPKNEMTIFATIILQEIINVND